MNQDRESQSHQQPPLKWLLECLDASRRMNEALMRNDLTAIEGCLEREAALVSGSPDRKSENMAISQDQAIPRSIIQEIRSLNENNRALISNGFEFARTLFEVIRPPATYSSLGAGNPQPVSADEHRLSVKG